MVDGVEERGGEGRLVAPAGPGRQGSGAVVRRHGGSGTGDDVGRVDVDFSGCAGKGGRFGSAFVRGVNDRSRGLGKWRARTRAQAQVEAKWRWVGD